MAGAWMAAGSAASPTPFGTPSVTQRTSQRTSRRRPVTPNHPRARASATARSKVLVACGPEGLGVGREMDGRGKQLVGEPDGFPPAQFRAQGTGRWGDDAHRNGLRVGAVHRHGRLEPPHAP